MMNKQYPVPSSQYPGKQKLVRAFVFLVTGYWMLATLLSGCGPTYPKGTFKESIIRMCKSEYKLDVKVATTGKTVVIYLPLPDLIDFTFAITKSASEKINDVILSVTRVAISTDAQCEYYVIIAHDVRIPEIQIVIIKSVDDVKRFLLGNISRDDYSKRMLIDMRLNPQAQKERSVREVFEKMSLDPKWQEQVMNDFFRSEPTGLSDIGYWNGRFFIKDIAPGEFIAEQIAGRMRMLFKEDKALAEALQLKSVKGLFVARGGRGVFKVEALAQPRFASEGTSQETARRVFTAALQTAAKVMGQTKFTAFDAVEITDLGSAKTVTVTRDDLEALGKRKKKLDDIIR